ncbi:MAG TPA: alpha/beta hydrolase [Solirubrobacteraceae bacterium]|jgi:acetyl esterase|nr:alpha/beta hydrolase [Solirubrobacteraceae bacterium]
MTLDPQVQGLLEQFQAMGLKDFCDMSVEEARQTLALFIQLEGDAEDVAEVKDLEVPGPGGDIPVRAYRVSGEARPIIVYYHGGGFVLGDIEVADKPCRQLANASDCHVVSVDYRLAPEAKAPAGAEDCYAATAWVAEHASELGGDGRLAVSGDSAGGNLAAVVPLMARERGGPDIALQILLYPIVDAVNESSSRSENGEGYLLTQASMRWFEDHYLNGADVDASDLRVSPLHGDLSGLPPAIVVTAGYDPLRDEGNAYAAKLKEAGVPTVHLQNPGMIHGFMWLGGAIGHTAGVYEEVGQHARETLGAVKA